MVEIYSICYQTIIELPIFTITHEMLIKEGDVLEVLCLLEIKCEFLCDGNERLT